MRKFKVLVLSDAVDGSEKEYNDWYTGRHLGDIVALPGFTNGQRFKLERVVLGSCPNKYLAIYDMETDDPAWVIENMFAQRDTDAMPISPAINLDTINVSVFEVFTDVIAKKK